MQVKENFNFHYKAYIASLTVVPYILELAPMCLFQVTVVPYLRQALNQGGGGSIHSIFPKALPDMIRFFVRYQ